MVTYLPLLSHKGGERQGKPKVYKPNQHSNYMDPECRVGLLKSILHCSKSGIDFCPNSSVIHIAACFPQQSGRDADSLNVKDVLSHFHFLNMPA